MCCVFSVLQNDGCVVSTMCYKMMGVLCLQCVLNDDCAPCVVSTVCCEMMDVLCLQYVAK